MTYNPTDISTIFELKNIIKLSIIDTDIIIRGENIKSLGNVEKVTGFLGFSDSNIQTLGNLKMVKKDFWISSYSVLSKLTSLNKLEFVGGDIGLRYSNIKNLGNLKKVGGKLNLRDTKIENLGNLEFVGGDLFLPKRLEKIVDLSRINIKGKIRFWNDNKKEKQVISKDKRNAHLENLQNLENEKNYEKAWELKCKDEYISIKSILEYENNLNRELLNGELIAKIAGYSHLTEFGQNNINRIMPFANKQLQIYKDDKGKKFFDLFLENEKPIRTCKVSTITEKRIIFGFFKKQQTEIKYVYNSEYYKEFFLSTSEYEYYKSIDDNQKKSGYISLMPHVVEKAIFNQCRLILKKAEDLYREKIGMPKVGEGWISETELFYKISEYFKEYEVIQHASPNWLGRQHLDIYLPKLNIGIEYQGTQHYEPIEFFGGKEAFKKTVERDERKKELCAENDCVLIYAEKGYDLNEITSTVKQVITVHTKELS